MTSTADRPAARSLLLFLVSVLVLGALLYGTYGQRQRVELRPGDPSPVSFTAPIDLEITDRIATERQKQSARAQISEISATDARLQQLVLSSLPSAELPEGVLSAVTEAYRQPEGVTELQLQQLINRVLRDLPVEQQTAARSTLEERLVPTAIPSRRLTEAAREAAAAAVAPVLRSVQSGQVIVREGEPLSEDQLAMLQATGLYNARSDVFRQTGWIVAGCILLAALLSFALLHALTRVTPRLSFPQVLFLTFMTLAVIAAQYFALMVSPNFLFVLLVPLLLAALQSELAAILAAVWCGVTTALLAPSGALFALLFVIVGGIVAARFARIQHTRNSLFLAGTAGGVTSILVLIAMALTIGGYTPLAVINSSLLLLAGGMIAGIVSLGLLPLAESSFGFMTEYRLLELSSPTSPLLQRLLMDAPGTYQHSLVISNLVEQAVKRIGGNPLLARVGALYHDVGKLKRPQFFTENQVSGDNPHDRISPHLSYLIITAHVREGLELLRDYGLPADLEAFVAEHHGTTVLSYFYKRALEESSGLDELNFRYPGPRPRSRETAVLMLADAVESASRSLQEPNQGSIRALIDRLVEQRLQDGQLAESQLNLTDIEEIKDTFERMLTAIMHRRVAYPSAEEIGRLQRSTDRSPEPLASRAASS
jgi:putative nucleotidyltransferase with HDIG domain